jgi:hypothetical protein
VMASTHDLTALHTAIDSTPIIDNHAHPLLKAAALEKFPLLSVATEAHGDALRDSPSSLAHIRATKQLAHLLGCDPTWEAVEASIKDQRANSPDTWSAKCLAGIETLLLDDGLDGGDDVQDYSWHDQFVKSKCKRIVRIEAVAKDIIRARLVSAGAEEEDKSVLESILEDFSAHIEQSLKDPAVVGFKSIICCKLGSSSTSRTSSGANSPLHRVDRGGLDIPRSINDIAQSDIKSIIKSIRQGHKDGNTFERLQHLPLNQLLVHYTAKHISQSLPHHKKPIQFHTGLGDNDISLTKASPSHLQPFISEYPDVPIVILHASYPWTREAGYLAAMYPNVYADIGEVFPFVSQGGQENIIRQILELCPWSKILWSTDGHWFPETYFLAVVQMKEVLKTVSSNRLLNYGVISC